MTGRDEQDLPLAQPLTPREQEVLDCIGDGMSNRQIAEQLTIAVSTVKWYMRQIYNKLGVDNRADAVSRARSLGLLEGKKEHTIRHNLPVAATPFVGREKEMDTLAELIADRQLHIITIIGPGGIGKTRLALEVAGRQLTGTASGGRQRVASFPDGVYFVNLAPLNDVEQIIPAMAQSLQFSLQSDDPRSPRQQVLDYLAHKRILLVMDNFEHLRDGVDLLVEMAQAAPGLRVLVTTRDRLHLQLEQVYPLQGLAFPGLTQSAPETEEDALAYTAIQLFRQCAQRIQPDFDLQLSKDIGDTARICRLIAGMPLAIELAAAWVNTISMADIAAEIQQSLDFLETERRDMPERHRSVRAAIDTSWDRLAKQEQTTLAYLSVFRGGFTRDAVQAVTGASVATLSQLVNKSFLQYDRENNRYQIHELLRQFAAEKLALEPEEETAVRDRHSATYCAFLQEHAEKWYTGQQMATLAATTSEAENARLALRWALAQREWQRLAEAMDSWAWFLDWQGRTLDGESFCQTIIDKAEAEDAGETAISAECLRVWVRARAWLDWFAEDYRNLSDNSEQSLALLERPQLAGQDIRRDKAFVRWRQAKLLVILAPDEARWLYEQLLIEYQAMGDQWGITECLFGLGRIDFDTGHFTSALERVQAVEQIYRERGDRRYQAQTLSMLGFIHQDLGHLDEAERLHREALSRSLEIGYKGNLSWQQANLARTLLCQGRLREASQLAAKSLATVEELGGARDDVATARLTICGVQIYAGQYERAQEELARVSPFVEKEGSIAREASLSHLQGLLALIDSSYVQAQSAFATSLRIWHSTYPHHFMTPLAALGLATFRLGQLMPAQQHLAEAISSALTYESITPALATLPVIALVLAENGDEARAVEIWTLAKSYPFIANSKWFEDVAGRELEELTASLPPDAAAAARARGQELDLWDTAEQLLTELG